MWTQGPVRRDCAPWEVTWKEIPLLIFVWYSKMMDSHFLPETATTLDFSHSTKTSGDGSIGKGSRRLHGSHRHPSSPWRQTTGVDCKGLGVLLSPILDLLCTMKLHLMAESFVTTLYGFHQWVPLQCKNVLFQHAFRSACIWAEFKIKYCKFDYFYIL